MLQPIARALVCYLLSEGTSGSAFAHHLCSQSSNPLGPELTKKWGNHLLGCPSTDEADLPVGNGRFADFENGQIIHSRDQKMVVAGFTAKGTLTVEFNITDQYNYSYFSVRSTELDQHDFGKPDADTDQYDVPAVAGTSGQFVLDSAARRGSYPIFVEGCDKTTWGSDCRQGWAHPVAVDVGLLDVAHKVDGFTPLPPAMVSTNGPVELESRARLAYQDVCRSDQLGDFDEGFIVRALAKLEMARHPGAGTCNPNDPQQAIHQVNQALGAAKRTTEVGTDLRTQRAWAGVIQGALGGCAIGAVIGAALFGPLGGIIGCGIGALALGAALGKLMIKDSHEYNARPYERFLVMALRNLAAHRQYPCGQDRSTEGARLPVG